MTSPYARAGLTPRALAAWAGTDRLSALPIERLRALPLGPAAAALACFVAGRTIPRTLARFPLDERLVEITNDDEVRARVAVLPIAEALVVADPPRVADGVEWPDDSSYHLLRALPPGRRERWLDLGCGSAIAQLARPALAEHRIAIDIAERAVAYARLGAELSGIALDVERGDVGDAPRRSVDLVTCNAPISGGVGGTWRATDASFFERLFTRVPAWLRPDGLAVIHAVCDALPVDDLPGERVLVTYTPPGIRAFGVLWWRPHAPARCVTGTRLLTDDRPHVDAGDRDALLGSC